MPLLVSVHNLKKKKMMKEKEKAIAIVKVIDPSKLKLVSTNKHFEILSLFGDETDLNAEFKIYRVIVGKIRYVDINIEMGKL